jgi:hypothetical protein
MDVRQGGIAAATKVERQFACLQIFHRLVVRYEYHPENFLGFVHLRPSRMHLDSIEAQFMRWLLLRFDLLRLRRLISSG